MVGILAVMWAVSLGCGLALERLLRIRMSNALLLPLGLCASLVVIFPGYVAGVGDPLAIALLTIVTLAGFAFARDGLTARLNPGWPGMAGIGTYVLYMLPVLAHGRWTWAGYDFVNDSAFQMLLAEHIRESGTVLGHPPLSSEQQFLTSYLNSAYPLGTQSLLGTYGAILDVPAAVIYQGFISTLAALAGIALASLAERVLSGPRAALIAFVAVAANLTYQYALQGGIKEIGLLATFTATAALASAAASWERPYAGAALVAIGVAASLAVYNAVAAPYMAALVLFLGIGVLVTRRARPRLRWLGPPAAGAVIAAVLALPALTTFSTFFHVAQTGQASTGTGSTQFGQLLRALPISQISGVWLAGEYRAPVIPEPAATLTLIATVVVLVLALPGALWALRRQAVGPLLALGSVGLILLVVFPRVSPYAGGKLLAMGSPAVLLAALLPLAALKGRLRPLGGLALAALAIAVLASDVLAYGRARVAPTSRMEAIQQVGERFRGQGLVMWNEFEEYAKYFGRSARISVPFETLTPQQVELRDPTYFYGHYFDLDEELLSFVEGYPLIVTRRSPAASRPPANYERVYENAYYVVWRRLSRPRVLAHLPEQSLYSPAAAVGCGALARMVAHAPHGSELVSAIAPELRWYEPLYSRDRSYGWGIDPAEPGAIVPNTPGHATGVVDLGASGSYAVWAQGDFPRPAQVRLDGRLVGRVSGSDTPLQWTRVTSVFLRAGRHTLEVSRPAGHRYFGPGEWNIGTVGPVALQREQPETMQALPLARWRTVCGTRRDWVELVRP
jgi:hypothetical protein